MYQHWDMECMDILIVLNKKKKLCGYDGDGDFNLLKSKSFFGLINRDGLKKNYVFTGIQLVNPKIFNNINKKVFSFNELFDLLIKITKNKNVLFVQQNLNSITRGTKEVKVVRVEQHLKDFNWVWSWVIQETGIETNPNDFYKHYAPERKLNSKGHELVAKVMKKYVQ